MDAGGPGPPPPWLSGTVLEPPAAAVRRGPGRPRGAGRPPGASVPRPAAAAAGAVVPGRPRGRPPKGVSTAAAAAAAAAATAAAAAVAAEPAAAPHTYYTPAPTLSAIPLPRAPRAVIGPGELQLPQMAAPPALADAGCTSVPAAPACLPCARQRGALTRSLLAPTVRCAHSGRGQRARPAHAPGRRRPGRAGPGPVRGAQ